MSFLPLSEDIYQTLWILWNIVTGEMGLNNLLGVLTLDQLSFIDERRSALEIFSRAHLIYARLSAYPAF